MTSTKNGDGPQALASSHRESRAESTNRHESAAELG